MSEVVESDALDARVDAWARNIASRSPQALSIMKEIFLTLDRGQPADSSELRELFQACFKSADLREWAAAFLQKRQPRFADRRVS